MNGCQSLKLRQAQKRFFFPCPRIGLGFGSSAWLTPCDFFELAFPTLCFAGSSGGRDLYFLTIITRQITRGITNAAVYPIDIRIAFWAFPYADTTILRTGPKMSMVDDIVNTTPAVINSRSVSQRFLALTDRAMKNTITIMILIFSVFWILSRVSALCIIVREIGPNIL